MRAGVIFYFFFLFFFSSQPIMKFFLINQMKKMIYHKRPKTDGIYLQMESISHGQQKQFKRIFKYGADKIAFLATGYFPSDEGNSVGPAYLMYFRLSWRPLVRVSSVAIATERQNQYIGRVVVITVRLTTTGFFKK